jgi:hypothetical protein
MPERGGVYVRPMAGWRSIGGEVAVVLGAFVGATALAELLGAVNMGTALTFGQLAFAATLLWVLVRS